MAKIGSIYIACYRYDVRYTRACVASVRHWHPELPIFLIKDHFYGPFNTVEIERHWNVAVMETNGRLFNWGFSKLEVLFLPPGQRCLVLDSDVVLAGPVLPMLEKFDEDVLVQHEDPTPEFVASHYYDPRLLHSLDPKFCFPGYTFNTGQWVANTGLLKREDFSGLVDWRNPPQLKHPSVFRMGEQGLLNYMLQSKVALGALTLRRVRMMETPKDPRATAIRIEDLTTKSPHDFVVHWCGLKRPRWTKIIRGDLLCFFENAYYGKVFGGWFRKRWRPIQMCAVESVRKFARGILRRKKKATPI
jgi:hypothetical protein